jgi:hypothetical protein
MQKYILKLFKIFALVIATIIFLILVVNISNFTIYYFSSSWISKEEIINLEKKALDNNCNASMELFCHYKKVIFKSNEKNKWLSKALLCQAKEDGPRLINKGLSPLRIITTFKSHGVKEGIIKGTSCAYIGIGFNYDLITRIEIYDKKKLLHTIGSEKNKELRELGKKHKGFLIDENELSVTSCKKVEILNYDNF